MTKPKKRLVAALITLLVIGCAAGAAFFLRVGPFQFHGLANLRVPSGWTVSSRGPTSITSPDGTIVIEVKSWQDSPLGGSVVCPSPPGVTPDYGFRYLGDPPRETYPCPTPLYLEWGYDMPDPAEQQSGTVVFLGSLSVRATQPKAFYTHHAQIQSILDSLQ